jgi:hypothetical protein
MEQPLAKNYHSSISNASYTNMYVISDVGAPKSLTQIDNYSIYKSNLWFVYI